MRKLGKIILSVLGRITPGSLLLVALVAIWLVEASTPAGLTGAGTFDGFDVRAPRVLCGIGCGQVMLLDPAILARHVETVSPGATKPPYRPARFAFVA